LREKWREQEQQEVAEAVAGGKEEGKLEL